MAQPIDVSDKGFNTRAIYAGRDPSCSSQPIYLANVGKDFYSRHKNPTTTALQDGIKSLEGGAYAESAACGVSAITQVFMTLLQQGDRLLTHTQNKRFGNGLASEVTVVPSIRQFWGDYAPG